MSSTLKELTKRNISKRLGVSDYMVLVNAGVEDEKRIVTQASKKIKNKKARIPYYLSSGSPYVMLGLKINTKGKRIK